MTEAMKIPARWTFEDRGVAAGFEKHVREQLPWYDLATSAVAFLARHYVQPETIVYDLGCSTGNVGRAIAATLLERNAELRPIDSSAAMLERYAGPGHPALSRIEELEPEPFSLAIAFLAFQFVPVRERRPTLERLLASALPGGAVILVDKFAADGEDYEADAAIYRLTLDAKLRAGASAQEIIEKELSLVGAQRPLNPRLGTARAIELVPGLASSTPFFRFGQFGGVVYRAHEG